MSIEWPKCMDGACPKCGVGTHRAHQGYGVAGGVYVAYSICGCGAVLEMAPDCEGMSPERAQAAQKAADAILAQTWGEKKLQPGPYWVDLPGGHRYRLWFHGDRWTYTATPKPSPKDLPCEVHPDRFIRLERS